MKRRYLSLLIIFLILSTIFTYGCGNSQNQIPGADPQQNTVQNPPTANINISANQLKAMIKENQNLLIVDVREQDEWDSGHLQGSVLIPIGELESRIGEIPKDKKVVVVCASGARSISAADYLIQSGYKDVYNLKGGLMSWPDSLVK